MSLIKNKNKWISLLAVVLLIITVLFSGWTLSETKAADATEIWTYNDLLKIAEDPAGSYVMMADVNLKGRVWTPVDFTGTLDGNGHALLNASINSAGTKAGKSFDGKQTSYDTVFSGLFSSLVGAKVLNLKVLGLEVSLDTSEPTFIGGIAGYMENSEITDCSLYGKITLYTSGAAFGVGGIAGFGNGIISNTASEMTLVCVDKDRLNPNEQYMGGAYAAGYIDLNNNQIKIDAYDSDHGFVHNGGLAGMYFLYPEGTEHAGTITGNTVSGQITFFEDNEDGAAICNAFIGEALNESYTYDDSVSADSVSITQVEDVNTVLLPHSCTEPQFEQTVVAPTETENGYTEYRCAACEYSYRADYTPVIGNYVDPTEEINEAGIPMAKAPVKKTGGKIGLIIGIIVAVLILVALLLIFIKKKRVDRQREERRISRGRGVDSEDFGS